MRPPSLGWEMSIKARLRRGPNNRLKSSGFGMPRLVEAVRREDPDLAGRVVHQSRSGPDGAALQVSPAIGTCTVRETFHALRAPGAFKGANVGLRRGRNIAVAALAIGSDLK